MKEYEFRLERFLIKIFEQVEGIRILREQSIDIQRNNIIKYIPDICFELDGVKYIVEVKSKFSIFTISKFLERFNEIAKSTNSQAILMFFDQIPENYRSLIENNYNIQVFDVSNILYTIIRNKDLITELSGLVNFSLDNIVPRKPKLNITIKQTKRKSALRTPNYINELKMLEKGIKNSEKFENLLERIIKDIFASELDLFSVQKRTEDGINIFDMICKIKNTHDDFFSTIEKFFRSKYILFEFKNYNDKIKQGEICTTEKYLYGTALRNVAIIITREGIDDNGDKLVKGILRETGKLMLVLNDDDVIEMIRLYDNGDKVSDVLMKKLDDMLVSLEK